MAKFDVLAGNCISVRRKPDGLAAAAPVEPDPPQSSWYEDCVNFKGDAPVGGWNSAQDSVKFPTVESIMADMTACGNIGRGPSMFYSFGVPTVQARTRVRDAVRSRPVMFNNALPDSWTQAVGSVAWFQLDKPRAHAVMAQRIATALAKLSKGEVFLVVNNRKADHGGEGAYQLPDPNDNLINVWRDYEYPALQRNPQVTKVTCVALTDNLERYTDWESKKPARYETLLAARSALLQRWEASLAKPPVRLLTLS